MSLKDIERNSTDEVEDKFPSAYPMKGDTKNKVGLHLIFTSLVASLISFWMLVIVQLSVHDATFYQITVTVSNISMLPGLLFLCYLLIHEQEVEVCAEITICLAAMCSSTIYHLRDEHILSGEETATFGTDYEFLQRFDFTAAFFLIVLLPFTAARIISAASEHQCHWKVVRIMALLGTFPFVCVGMNSMNRHTTTAFLCASIAISLGAIYFIICLLVVCRKKGGLWVVLRELPACYVLLDLLLKITSIVAKLFLTNDDNYEIMHGLGWHLPGLLSFYFTFKWSDLWKKRISEISRRCPSCRKVCQDS